MRPNCRGRLPHKGRAESLQGCAASPALSGDPGKARALRHPSPCRFQSKRLCSYLFHILKSVLLVKKKKLCIFFPTKVSEKSWGEDNQWGQMTGGWRLLDGGEGLRGQKDPGGTQGTGGGNQAAGGKASFPGWRFPTSLQNTPGLGTIPENVLAMNIRLLSP